MKTRNGFVSNSSSSSFLVFFKKLPKSVKETINALWPDKPNGCLHLDYYDDVLPYSDAAKIIYNDIIRKHDDPHAEFDPSAKLANPVSDKAILKFLKQLYYVDTYKPRNPWANVQHFPYLSALPSEMQNILAKGTKLMSQLVKLEMRLRDLEESLYKEQDLLIITMAGKRPKYKNNYEKKADGTRLYSDEEVKEYTKEEKVYEKKRSEIIKSEEFLTITSSKSIEIESLRKEIDRIRSSLVKKDLAILKKEYKGYKACIFNYGDESGQKEALLEHGKTWVNVPFIPMSQH